MHAVYKKKMFLTCVLMIYVLTKYILEDGFKDSYVLKIL